MASEAEIRQIKQDETLRFYENTGSKRGATGFIATP